MTKAVTLTPTQALVLLESKILEAGSAYRFAKISGLSFSYVCEVRRGEKKMGPKIRNALGLTLITSFRESK